MKRILTVALALLVATCALADTEQLAVQHTAGVNVFFYIFDASVGAGANMGTFDWDDGAWETSLGACTTPKLAATEKTDAGDADESLYVASCNLATVYNTATAKVFIVQAMEDLAADTIVARMEVWIAAGVRIEPADVLKWASGNVTPGAIPNAAADAAGGLPVSDAGGLDIDTLLARLDAAISTRAPAGTALSNATWTDAKATYITQTWSAVTSVVYGNLALKDLILDVPTVAEFNARTLLAASYFDAAADTVARVTLCDTVTTCTDQRGTDNAALAATALSSVQWTDARAAKLDFLTANVATATALATVDGVVDAVLADTAELQGNQGNWATAVGFSTHSAADTATALKASTGWEVGNTLTFATVVKRLHASAWCKMAGVGDTVTIYDTDGTTVLGTFTITSSLRTPL